LKRVAVLAGDGIGPEVTTEAVRVLTTVAPDVVCTHARVGAHAITSDGVALPPQTLELCRESNAILFGAVGGPGFEGRPPSERPEAALLQLRAAFGLYANLRPARAFAGLDACSPLRPELIHGTDLIIVRELTGGLYYGEKSLREEAGVQVARDELIYRATEIERVARTAFELARTRSRRLASVDKSNVLMSSRLWRSVVIEVARDYPDVALEHILVDNAAMQLVRNPRSFDVIVTENMFGDILSDEAAAIAGTIGVAASASLGAPGERRFGLYEPIAGTAPDIAGRGIANPSAAILSAALLLRFSLGDEAAALRIERAVAETLEHGPRTADLDSANSVGTRTFTDAVLTRIGAAVTA
jgi:3-isopropylmalate dehydrogenase